MNQQRHLRAKQTVSRHASGSVRTAGRPKSRRHWLILTGLAVAALLVIGFFVFTEVDWQRLHRGIVSLNPVAVVTLMATLPLAGFSIGIFYLVAGAKFGVVMGGVVVAAATAFHLVATHWIARSFLHGPLKRFFARRKHQLPAIPEGENASISVMAALVPGLPYFARNYLLALSGIPLRTYFWICLPIYVARSYLVIFLGDLSSDPSRSRLLILGGIYVLKLAICGYLIARLRKRHHRTFAARPTAKVVRAS